MSAPLVLVTLFLAGRTSKASTTRGVTVDNFLLAESQTYMSKYVTAGAFGKFLHTREVTEVDETPSSAPTHGQKVIRMNRDTLYSLAVLDLRRPATVVFPPVGGRFVSFMVGSEFHDIFPALYSPGKYKVTRDGCGCAPPCRAAVEGEHCTAVGTSKAFIILRILADASNATDIAMAHEVQDGFAVKQANSGSWDVPHWNQTQLAAVRSNLLKLKEGSKPVVFGFFSGPEKIDHLFGILNVAAGWGGARSADQTYTFWDSESATETTFTLTMPQVPVEGNGFWSITVYNRDGFMFGSPSNYNSAAQGQAGLNTDGSTSVYFGGCDDPQRQKPSKAHCLKIEAGWNIVVRFFRPSSAVLDGTWTPPHPVADKDVRFASIDSCANGDSCESPEA